MSIPCVYFCVVVHNRWSNAVRLMRSFSAQTYEKTVMCIYDWNSKDHPLIESAADFYSAADNLPKANYRYSFDPNPANFGVTIGKNKAFDIADPSDDDIVFFIDSDVVIPPTMAADIAQTVKPGVAYFPVFYSLYEGCPAVVNGDGPPHHRGDSAANGWWRKSSHGNCGFTARDFVTIGKWDERFGDKYGRDDDDLAWRANQHLNVVRKNINGFFHFWHPVSTAPQNPRLRDTPWHPLYEGAKDD
jgi:glycosyltransferase involved in cell wall biosynthesis